MKARIVLALAVILLMAGSASVAAGGAAVPFRAILQTFPVETGFDPATGILSYDIPGEGQATHLGNSTFESVADFYLYGPYPWRAVCVGTLTAANGDRLNLNMEGTAVSGAGEGTWETADGGTGRFADVTGSGTFWFGFDGEEWHMYLDGTLTKP